MLTAFSGATVLLNYDLPTVYLALLSTAGIEPPLLHSSEYSCRADLQAEMFDFAAVQLALARLPRLLFPELLGFTIAYCQFPTLLEVCCPGRQLDAPFFRQRQRRIDKQLPLLQDCIRQYLELFPGQQQALWRRLQKGCWLYCHQMRCSRDGLFRVLDAPLSPSQAFARLLQQKAAAALGHHRKIQLQGTSLEGWFAGLPANSREFLQALRDSRYVDGSNPAESRLLQLFEADGPMFGVLDAQERDRVRDWLQHGSVRAEPAFERETEMTAGVDPPAGHSTVRVGRRSVSGRELYYQLVNGDLFPDAAQQARHRVKRLLQASALCHPAPFRQYSHARFDAFIKAIYQREISAYQPLQGKPGISRRAYVWGLQQMAPTVLIDGCWLQNSLDLHGVYPAISEILFRIYCDETGNGQLQ